MSYHIEYIPQTHDRTKSSKGNGGSIFNRDGCLKHNIAHCEDCPLWDCDWDYMVECSLGKKSNETYLTETNQKT